MNEKIILGLVGEKGAGKGTVSDYLTRNYGAEHFGTSKILKRTISDLRLPASRDNFAKLALVLKEGFGPTIVVDALMADIENQATKKLVIADGIRMHDDVAPFQKRYGHRFFLIYVTADMKLRHERSKQRNEKAGEAEMTFQEFLAEEARLTEVSIREIGQQADFQISNNGTPTELETQINQAMTQILNQTK